MNPAAIVVLVIFGVVEAVLIGIVVWLFVEELIDQYQGWQRRRRERFEAELDRKAAGLRRVVLELAEQLAADRDAASQELIRAAFLARTDRLE